MSSLHCIQSFDDLERELALISYLKKAHCQEALMVARTCRDLLGGNGVSNAYKVMRHLINLEAVNTCEGTDDIRTLIVARE